MELFLFMNYSRQGIILEKELFLMRNYSQQGIILTEKLFSQRNHSQRGIILADKTCCDFLDSNEFLPIGSSSTICYDIMFILSFMFTHGDCPMGQQCIAGAIVKPSTQVRYLGVMVDNELSLMAHINQLTRSCYYYILEFASHAFEAYFCFCACKMSV